MFKSQGSFLPLHKSQLLHLQNKKKELITHCMYKESYKWGFFSTIYCRANPMVFNHNYSQKIFNEVFKDWSKTLWKCNSPSYKVVHLLFKSALKAEYFQFKNAKKLPKETLGLQEHKRRDLKLHSYHCTERLVSKTLWAQEKPT